MLPGIQASSSGKNITQADTPERVTEAAQQFEALLLEQLLRSMRTEDSGWMGAGEDKSSASVMEYAEQEFARVMAAGGGFGLARMIGEGLKPPSRSAE
jgi:peptidoglycan hydrolase FlgJ